MKPMRSCEQPDLSKLQFPRYVSTKLDGIRIVKDNGKALTKSLKPIRNRHIATLVESNLFDGMDGEVIAGPPNDEGVYDRTYKAVMTAAGTPEFSIYLFDLHNEPLLTARERYALLLQKWKKLPEGVQEHVYVVRKVHVGSLELFNTLYDQALADGYEGLVSQDPDSFYVHGKTTPKSGVQFKHKPHADREFVIDGCYEAMENNNEQFVNEVGETVRSTHQENLTGKGMLGGFHARDYLSGVAFNVAPGRMKHDERTAIWKQWQEDPTSLIGKLGRYRSMDYGTMANGRPRHGRFYGWKDVTDL